MVSSKYIAAAAVIAVAVIACFSYITFNDGTNDPAFSIEVTAIDEDKIVTIEGSGDYFSQDISTDDILVYYIVLDGYLNEHKEFDSGRFVDDMEKEGAYDDDLGEYLPEFTQKIVDFGLIFVDSRNVSINFEAAGQYASYVIYFKDSGLVGIKGFPVSTFDLPDPEYVDTTPKMSILNGIYENIEDHVIVIGLENSVFSRNISEDDIELRGSFATLEVTDVTRMDDNRISIATSGIMERSTTYIGYVTVSSSATDYGEPLTATYAMNSTYVGIDENSFRLIDSILSFDIILSDTLCAVCDSIFIDKYEYPVSVATESEIEGYKIIKVSSKVPYDSIDSSIGYLNTLTISAVGNNPEFPGCDYSIYIPGAVVYADIDSYSRSGDSLEVKVQLLASSGSVDRVTSEDIILKCDYIGAKATLKNDTVAITVPDFTGDVFNAAITINKGVITPWGTDAGEYTMNITCKVTEPNAGITSDEMIEKLYKHMQFSKIFSGIEIAAGGIEAVISILGALNIIDTRSESEIQIAEILINTQEIKHMLADQAAVLSKMNKKLDDIIDTLKEAELRDYSVFHGNLVSANNDLANALRVYSEELKGQIWGMVIGNYDGKTLHIYITEDGSISVMQNSIFERTDVGQTIDGKSILPKYTIEIPIVKDKTFADARIGTGYSDKTEAKMIECLTKSVKELYGETYTVVKKDGTSKTFTAEEIAKGVCNGITTKFAQQIAKEQTGKDVLAKYFKYVETMANLVVQPDGSVVIGMDLRNNPVIAAQKIMKANFNFESEARKYLKNLDDSMVLTLYHYTMAVTEIQQLQGTGSDAVQKHYDKAMEFLKNHRGYRSDVTKESKDYVEYCYVSDSFIKANNVSLATEVEYGSSNGFKSNIKSPPAVRCGMQSAKDLRIPSSYISTEQLAKICKNYERLKASKEIEGEFYDYFRKAIGTEVTYRYILTSFDGGEYYGDDRHVVLYSALNLVSPGHKNMLVSAGKTYTIAGTIDKTGPFGGMYKAYSKDVYTKVAYKGEAYDMKTNSALKMASSSGNFIYTVGYYCDHVSAWSNDEAAVLTPQNCCDGVSFEHHRIYDNNHEWCRVMINFFAVETFGKA